MSSSRGFLTGRPGLVGARPKRGGGYCASFHVGRYLRVPVSLATVFSASFPVRIAASRAIAAAVQERHGLAASHVTVCAALAARSTATVAYPADPSGHRAACSSRVRKGHGAEQWTLFIACHSLA